MEQPETTPASLTVTGATRLYVVMGDPIVQVQSTHLYNSLCAERGIDAVFVPLQFATECFDVAVAALRSFGNLAGMIPTIPHKSRMLAVVDRASDRARQVGAVNSVRVEKDGRWIGDAFDGLGYVNGLKANRHDPAGACVQLLGIGGAGASMAFALAEAGASRLRLFDIDLGKAGRVGSTLSGAYPKLAVEVGEVDLTGIDIVANATPMGMRPDDPLPLDGELLAPTHLVTEMIMKPQVTPLLEAARSKGCATVEGYAALKGQAEVNMDFFFGR